MFNSLCLLFFLLFSRSYIHTSLLLYSQLNPPTHQTTHPYPSSLKPPKMLHTIPLQGNIVQGFRAVHKSYKPSSLTHIDPDDIIHINCYTDPETLIDFILWDEIQQAFEEALFVRCRTNGNNLLPYLKGADFRP